MYNNILMAIIAIGVVLLVTWITLTIYCGKKLRIEKEKKEIEMDDVVQHSAGANSYRWTNDNVNRGVASKKITTGFQKSFDLNHI